MVVGRTSCQACTLKANWGEEGLGHRTGLSKLVGSLVYCMGIG